MYVYSKGSILGSKHAIFHQMLGFDVKYVEPEDRAWGGDEGNLTWNGMVGMLQR